MSLTAAIKAGNVEEVKALLDKGADINKGDAEDNREPLHIAMEEDKLDIFQLLLERKANTNVKDSKGETLLSKSVTHEKAEYFDALIAAGADANIPGSNNMTPIAEKRCNHQKKELNHSFTVKLNAKKKRLALRPFLCKQIKLPTKSLNQNERLI